MHFGLGIMLKAPELELSDDEAKQYAKGVAMVARHYDMGASAKTLDWFNLMTTMASIYGVRVIAIAARRKAERRGGGPVVNGHDPGDFPGPGGVTVEAGPVEMDLSSMTGRGRPN